MPKLAMRWARMRALLEARLAQARRDARGESRQRVIVPVLLLVAAITMGVVIILMVVHKWHAMGSR